MSVVCPDCGAEMVLRETTGFRCAGGQVRKFFGCSRWPECLAIHRATDEGLPLGIPANRETRVARHRAHRVFDAAWQAREMVRSDAYLWLSHITGIPDPHMAMLDLGQCEAVITAVTEAERFRLACSLQRLSIAFRQRRIS